jgi:hypothetical protein
MACEEMQLFYAYLDAIEEEKRKSQPWQCEVTIVAPADEPAAAKQSTSAPAVNAASRFACDEPE